MKMITHVVFGAGVAAFLAPMLPVESRVVLAVVLSVLVNYAIDEIGHVVKGGFSVRSPVTHSVFTAPVWGGVVGYVVWLTGTSLGLVGPGLEWVVVVLGVFVAYSHLLLDSMTEGGVYFTTKRMAISHFGNENALLNAAFILCGLALFLL